MAGWQSGYAAACKAVNAGSIPASASMFTFKSLVGTIFSLNLIKLFNIVFGHGLPAVIAVLLIFYITSSPQLNQSTLVILSLITTSALLDLGLSKSIHLIFSEARDRKFLKLTKSGMYELCLYTFISAITISLSFNFLVYDYISEISFYFFLFLSFTRLCFVIFKSLVETNNLFIENLLSTFLFNLGPIFLIFILMKYPVNLIILNLVIFQIISLILIFYYLFKRNLVTYSNVIGRGNRLFNFKYCIASIFTFIYFISERLFVILLNFQQIGFIYFLIELSNKFFNFSSLVSHAIFVWAEKRTFAIQRYKFLISFLFIVTIAVTFCIFMITIFYFSNESITYIGASIICAGFFTIMGMLPNLYALLNKKLHLIYLAHIPSMIFFIYILLNLNFLSEELFAMFIIFKAFSFLIGNYLIAYKTFIRTD